MLVDRSLYIYFTLIIIICCGFCIYILKTAHKTIELVSMLDIIVKLGQHMHLSVFSGYLLCSQ